jgi:hypothetical protein
LPFIGLRRLTFTHSIWSLGRQSERQLDTMSSATRQFIGLLNDHAVQLMRAAQSDWHLTAERFARGEPPLHHRETFVGRLDGLLRPIDYDGPFFKAHDAAVRQCANLRQLEAFREPFKQGKYSYWRAWELARQAFTFLERLNWASPEFANLTRDIAEIRDLLPALDIDIPNERAETTSSLSERRVGELHNQFLLAAREFGDLRLLAVRPYSPIDNWPRVRVASDAWSIGVDHALWKQLFADLGFDYGKVFAPLATVWLKIDNELWEGALFNGDSTASSDEDAYTSDGRPLMKDGRPQSKLQAQFTHLQDGIEEFRRLSETAKLHFEVLPEPQPGTEEEHYLRDNNINRWLELIYRAGVWSSVEQRILRVRKLSADVFTASARTIEILLKTPPAPSLLMDDIPNPDSPERPHSDGPAPPNIFWWKGTAHELPPIRFRLLEFLWGCPDRTSAEDEVIEGVWGPECDVSLGTLKATVSKLGSTLLKSQIPISVGRKNGHVYLTVDRA